MSDLIKISSRVTWIFLFLFGCIYGYILYKPILDDWNYNPTVNDIHKTDFYVKEIPFPAISICSNNAVVKRQVESVLLTQPWKALNKTTPNFENDFNSALAALAIAQDSPNLLKGLTIGTINILNRYHHALPEVMKKVLIIAEIYTLYLSTSWI